MKQITLTILILYPFFVMANDKIEDQPSMVKIMMGAKMAGFCQTMISFKEYQKNEKIPGGDEFIDAFLPYVARVKARQDVDEYFKTCKNVITDYEYNMSAQESRNNPSTFLTGLFSTANTTGVCESLSYGGSYIKSQELATGVDFFMRFVQSIFPTNDFMSKCTQARNEYKNTLVLAIDFDEKKGSGDVYKELKQELLNNN